MTETSTRLTLPYPTLDDTADVPRDIGALVDRLEEIMPDLPIGTAELSDGAVTGAKLAAAVLAPWRTVAEGHSFIGGTTTSGNHLYRQGSGASVLPEGSGGNGFAIFYFQPTDHALTGRTLAVRQRCTWVGNSTAPGALVLTYSVRKLTANGGAANALVPVLHATTRLCPDRVLTPDVPENTLSAVGAASTTPEAGFYAMCCSLSIAAPSGITGYLHTRIEARYT